MSIAPTSSYPSIATLICIILEVYNNNLSHVMESGCDIFCMRNFEWVFFLTLERVSQMCSYRIRMIVWQKEENTFKTKVSKKIIENLKLKENFLKIYFSISK